MAPQLSSAKCLLGMLTETDSSLIEFALNRLNTIVDAYWFEMAAHISTIEELHESEDLMEPVRQKAALLASRVFFHLGAFDDSVRCALAAGAVLNVNVRSDYVDTILGKCIDQYVASREEMAAFQLLVASPKAAVAASAAATAAADVDGDNEADANNGKPQPPKPIDPRLERMFEHLATTWRTSSAVFSGKELVGFMLRARRVDLLEAVLKNQLESTKSADLLNFCLSMANAHVKDIAFRTRVLRCLAALYQDGLAQIDHFALVECLLFLNDDEAVGGIILDLLKNDKRSVAYQIAFDLFESASQEFLQGVLKVLDGQGATSSAAPAANDDDKKEQKGTADPNIAAILSGELTTDLHLKFLYSQCKADVHILNQTKKVIPAKVSATHTAAVMSAALMYSGTTIHGFLSDNMEWLGRATNWAKFIATASLGVIHKGHTAQAMKILQPYLPTSATVGALPFMEAGGLYALGLIYSGIGVGRKNHETIDYLRNALRTYSASEQMVHGASLGLGLAAMGLHSEELFDALFVCVNGSGAVPGEGAALAIGLVMLGAGKEQTIRTLLRCASENGQKEKTVRGLMMAIALMLFGREGEADALVEELSRDKDHWIRVGACFTLGLAYAATSDNSALERLLSICVKDVNNEVRRTATMMIGIVTLTDPTRCLTLTKAFADSYNPHIRYGVCMALGIAAAGTGDANCVRLLSQLKEDMVDFVRQGAMIASAMVMVQQTEKTCPESKKFRKHVETKAADQKADICSRFGAILAQGLIDAGGRNCTIQLHTRGHAAKKAIVGAFLFTQYWYWFPYTFMITLSFQPTCIIGLTDELEMPEYEFVSNAPPSNFNPPPSVLIEKKEAKEKSQKRAVLSTTAKTEQYKKKKMEKSGSTYFGASTEAQANAESDKKPSEEKKEDEEAKMEVLHNPARVIRPQVATLEHKSDPKYRPLREKPGLGICMLSDVNKEAPKKLVDVDLNKRNDDVPPPEPFDWP